jgi:hypothetical protein
LVKDSKVLEEAAVFILRNFTLRMVATGFFEKFVSSNPKGFASWKIVIK